jgi:hypothetical protein
VSSYSNHSKKWDEGQFQMFLNKLDRMTDATGDDSPGKKPQQSTKTPRGRAKQTSEKSKGKFLDKSANLKAAGRMMMGIIGPILSALKGIVGKEVKGNLVKTKEMLQDQPENMTMQWVNESARYGIHRSEKEVNKYLEDQRRIANMQLYAFRKAKRKTGILPAAVYDAIDWAADWMGYTQKGVKSYWDDYYQKQQHRRTQTGGE